MQTDADEQMAFQLYVVDFDSIMKQVYNCEADDVGL